MKCTKTTFEVDPFFAGADTLMKQAFSMINGLFNLNDERVLIQ